MRDTNFKVGDRVRIRSWEDMKKEFGGGYDSIRCKYSFTYKMKHLCGRISTLERIDSDGSIRLGSWENTNGEMCWSFSTDMIEKVENSQIITYREGNKVISKLEVDGKVIKTAEAKCCPTDIFDFNIGAKLSLERLFKEEPKEIYIRLLTSGGFDFNEKGDILKAYKKPNSDVAYVLSENQIRSVRNASSKEWAYLPYEYEILENYVPKPQKPQVKEVSRKAKKGEYIKIINREWSFNEVGDILKISETSGGSGQYPLVENSDHPRGGKNTTDEDYLWGYFNRSNYVVLENYIPHKKDYKVKVGDYIQLTTESYSFDKKGMILKVNEVKDNMVYVLPEGYPKDVYVYYSPDLDGWNYREHQYKVLKDYVPPKSNKGRDLIGRKIKAGTRFKVINIEPHKTRKDLILIDALVGEIGTFNTEFTFYENTFDGDDVIFDKKYVNEIYKVNEINFKWDEVEILN